MGSLPLKLGPLGCPETSAINYHYCLRNNPEECSCRLRGGGSQKSRLWPTSIETQDECSYTTSPLLPPPPNPYAFLACTRTTLQGTALYLRQWNSEFISVRIFML